MILTKKKMLAPLAALTLLAVAGCGSTGQPAASSATQASASASASESGHAGHDHGGGAGATETAEPSPRIAVSTETGVVLLDEHLEVLDSYQTRARPSLTLAHDARHIFAVQVDADIVNVLDSGTWTQAHGDHFHSFVAEPAMFEEALEGGKPVHVVPNAEAGVTAVYFDDDGRAQIVDTEALEHAELHGLPTVGSTGPHHGVVVPLANGSWLVTQPVGAETGTPNTVELTSADGAVQQRFDCEKLHGEVVVGNTAAFGCVGQVLIVRDGVATSVATPTQTEARVGRIVSDATAQNFLGNFGKTGLVFISNDTATQVDIGTEYSNFAVTADGRFAVLGTDGVLRLYDAAGTELQTFQVTGAWQKPTGHGGVAPAVAAGVLQAANMIWVTEPGANKVHAVDLFSNTVTSADVDGAPASIAVANAG